MTNISIPSALLVGDTYPQQQHTSPNHTLTATQRVEGVPDIDHDLEFSTTKIPTDQSPNSRFTPRHLSRYRIKAFAQILSDTMPLDIVAESKE